jgi:hypothetical protein
MLVVVSAGAQSVNMLMRKGDIADGKVVMEDLASFFVVDVDEVRYGRARNA